MKSSQTKKTVYDSQAATFPRIRVALVLSFFASYLGVAEAKMGTHIVKPFGKSAFDFDPEVFQDQVIIDPEGNTVTSSLYYIYRNGYSVESTTTSTARGKESSPLSCATDVGDLATCFQQALVAVNESEEKIHVGQLLSASEQLEASMRRIGFVQSANDIKGNVAKIRNLYEHIPANQRDSMPALLQYEIESGILDAKGVRKIPENSATMGLLWLGRSLNYQHDMFSYMLDNNCEPFEAASHAYDQDIKPHLSWPVQKVCQAAMKTLKKFRQKDILAQIGGFSEEYFGSQEDQATRRDLHQMMNNLKPMLSRWREVFSDLELENI